jgi:hypothetical protein
VGVRRLVLPRLVLSQFWPDGVPEDGGLTYWGVDDVAEAVRAAIEAESTEHTPPSDVGDDIVTATVRTPPAHGRGLHLQPTLQHSLTSQPRRPSTSRLSDLAAGRAPKTPQAQ